MSGGYGLTSWGRCEWGNAKSGVEPRFEASVPVDNTEGVSVYQTVVNFRIYGFSSRIQKDSLLIEISEDNGVTFNNAYILSAFIAPYNGAKSLIDAHQGESNIFRIVIEKTSTWTDEEWIVFRFSAKDEFNQVVSKVTPVVWGE